MTPRNDFHSTVTAARPQTDQRFFALASGFLVLVGAAAFIAGVGGLDPQRAWQAYLVNFVFWTGLASGCMLFSAVLTITNARWGRPLKRIAEAPGAFLPVSFLLFWVLYPGKDHIFPWIAHPIPAKTAWLNVQFLFARDGLGLLLLAAVALATLYHSIKRDQKALAAGTMDLDEANTKDDPHGHALTILAPVYGILYAFILTLIAFDLIMSLSPHWHSTLFGAYYFMSSFYAALAALTMLAAYCLKTMGMERFIQPGQFHNLGKLMMGFCLVTGDFFFTQFLVIWYGNLPEETHFVITRINMPTWKPLAWTVLIGCFVLPFVVLLNRTIKMRLRPMLALCALVLTGMWLERLLLVAPSLWTAEFIPLGLMEACITAGFFGLLSLCVIQFFKRFPMLPVGDPLFWELMKKESQ